MEKSMIEHGVLQARCVPGLPFSTTKEAKVRTGDSGSAIESAKSH